MVMKQIKIEVGAVAELPFVVSEQDLDAFAHLSGDANPLHCNDAYARSHGFRSRVVHGARIVAHISKMLGMTLPGNGWIWHSLNIRFRAPLYIGDEAILTGKIIYEQEALEIVRMEVTLRKGDEVLADGDVQAGRLSNKS